MEESELNDVLWVTWIIIIKGNLDMGTAGTDGDTMKTARKPCEVGGGCNAFTHERMSKEGCHTDSCRSMTLLKSSCQTFTHQFLWFQVAQVVVPKLFYAHNTVHMCTYMYMHVYILMSLRKARPELYV